MVLEEESHLVLVVIVAHVFGQAKYQGFQGGRLRGLWGLHFWLHSLFLHLACVRDAARAPLHKTS